MASFLLNTSDTKAGISPFFHMYMYVFVLGASRVVQ